MPNREPLKPVPEHYAGKNYPYRGTETHGVPDPTYTEPDVEFKGEDQHAVYEEPVPETPPIPVRIVTEHSREIKSFRVVRYLVDMTAILLLGQERERTKCRIRNTDPVNTVFIGASGLNPWLNGYPILPGQEVAEIATTDAIWAVAPTAPVAVAVFVEFNYEA